MKSCPPGAETTSPTAAPMSDARPTSAARNIHFSHMSSRIDSDRRAWNFGAPSLRNSASIAAIVSEREPSRSP